MSCSISESIIDSKRNGLVTGPGTKRIVLGNQTVPIRPLPVGNLSSPLGDAECHFINNHFYCFSQFTVPVNASDLS